MWPICFTKHKKKDESSKMKDGFVSINQVKHKFSSVMCVPPPTYPSPVMRVYKSIPVNF